MPDSPTPARRPARPLHRVAARGAHEVIVNNPLAVTSLAQLTAQQVQDAVAGWRERMRAQTGAAYVHLCVNERLEAGATQPHTHAQLFALDFVPAAVARERERFSAHAVRTMGSDLLDDLIQEEVRRRDRIVAIDDEAVLTCPYASRTSSSSCSPRAGGVSISRTRARRAPRCCTTRWRAWRAASGAASR